MIGSLVNGRFAGRSRTFFKAKKKIKSLNFLSASVAGGKKRGQRKLLIAFPHLSSSSLPLLFLLSALLVFFSFLFFFPLSSSLRLYAS